MVYFRAKITIEAEPDKLLDQGKVNEGQKMLVHLVATKADPYVPWLSGDLKNSAKENKKSITYSPWHGGTKSYAWIQYRYNVGLGREGTSRGGKRGSNWIGRMWYEGGKEEITGQIAKFLGGRAE